VGTGFYRLDEARIEEVAANLKGRGRKLLQQAGTGSGMPATGRRKYRKCRRKTEVFLSDPARLLSSAQKWSGEGRSLSMWSNQDTDLVRTIVQLLREQIDQVFLEVTIFIKIRVKAHRVDSLNELADRWADMGRGSENIRWSLPTNRPIFSWTDNGKTYQSPMNPRVKEESTFK